MGLRMGLCNEYEILFMKWNVNFFIKMCFKSFHIYAIMIIGMINIA